MYSASLSNAKAVQPTARKDVLGRLCREDLEAALGVRDARDGQQTRTALLKPRPSASRYQG